MKKLVNLFGFMAAVYCLSLTSCVSKGKFLIAEGRNQRLEADSANTHGQLATCLLNKKQLEDENAQLRTGKDEAEKDLENLASKSNMTIAQQAKRLKDLQDLIQREKDAMNKLRKSIADALVNFKPDELSVYIKDGNVYVALQEKLLFKSGSAVVGSKGKDALSTLASVLNVTPDITVTIEGHTDTVPIKNSKFEDNWELSVARANSIVRILTKDYNVDPHNIIAAGRGEFHPVSSNETDEGRSQNRRTEIILSPNLSDLYKLSGNNCP